MSTVQDIYNIINKEAPFSTAMCFDNVGILVGDSDKKVSHAMIVLDITRAVINEAESKNVQLIISHHPVIFDPLKSVNRDSPVYNLINRGISAIGCHTNLDISMTIGVNKSLSDALGLINFSKIGECLFTAELKEPMTVRSFAELVNYRLSTRCSVTCPERLIKKIALCSGAGGELIPEAVSCADAFLTGEAHHDELIFAADKDFPVMVAGHYGTEKIFDVPLKKYLQENIRDVEFLLSETEKNPITII